MTVPDHVSTRPSTHQVFSGRPVRATELRARIRDIASEISATAMTSLYLDIDGRRRPSPSERQRPFTVLAQQARRRAEELGVAAARAVESDLKWIATWLHAHGGLSHVRGLAFFVCSEEDRHDVVQLAMVVRDQVVVGRRADVRQLEAVIGSARDSTVVLVDRQRSRIFACSLGTATELVDVVETLPRRHDQGGWSALSLQRHVDELARQHHARVVELIVERAREHPGERLLLGGPDEDVAVLERMLPPVLRPPRTQRISIRVGSLESEIERAMLEAVDRLDGEEELAVARDVVAGVRAGTAVPGLVWTLSALAERRARLLLIAAGCHASGGRCTACGMLTTAERRCPRCEQPTSPVDDVITEAIADALATDCAVRVIPDDAMPDSLCGIAAVLRY